MSDTNVGMGMVACRKGCRCDECEITRYQARIATLEAEVETYKTLAVPHIVHKRLQTELKQFKLAFKPRVEELEKAGQAVVALSGNYLTEEQFYDAIYHLKALLPPQIEDSSNE